MAGLGFRYQGHTDWYRESKPWKIRSKDLPVEAVDVSGSVINYDGLDNLVRLSALKSLNLSHCPHIDDWSLSRLHAFRETLEDLSLAGCPQVTERGLTPPALTHPLAPTPFPENPGVLAPISQPPPTREPRSPGSQPPLL
uniref:Distal membrane arm assembly component 2 n=1 Tax=Sphenodon punctatus TaxID=8508 RepID=A0A8D0L9L2_SPHPU